MAYTWITWLADALRAEGLAVIENAGWSSRGRPSSTGSFSPYGVLWHHTANQASYANPAPGISVLINGRSDLPGPLCHASPSFDGSVQVIAAGRANHAGSNRGSGPIGPGDGNAQMVGLEINYAGYTPMSPEQYVSSIKCAAAILRRLGRDASYARGHVETSKDGKWDPGVGDGASHSMNLNAMRADLAACLASPPGVWGGGSITPTPPPEDEVTQDDINAIVNAVTASLKPGIDAAASAAGKAQVSADAAAQQAGQAAAQSASAMAQASSAIGIAQTTQKAVTALDGRVQRQGLLSQNIAGMTALWARLLTWEKWDCTWQDFQRLGSWNDVAYEQRPAGAPAAA